MFFLTYVKDWIMFVDQVSVKQNLVRVSILVRVSSTKIVKFLNVKFIHSHDYD